MLTLIVFIIGLHCESHCWGIMTSPFCRASRPDPRGGKGAKSAAKAPTGTTAMATSGAASIARVSINIIKVGAGARAAARRCCPPWTFIERRPSEYLSWPGVKKNQKYVIGCVQVQEGS